MVWTKADLNDDDVSSNDKYDDTNDVTQCNADNHMEPWVRIQNQTFTNWVNDKLRSQDLFIDDLTRKTLSLFTAIGVLRLGDVCGEEVGIMF